MNHNYLSLYDIFSYYRSWAGSHNSYFFIAFPFLLEGLILTIGGGVLSSSLVAFSLNLVYAQMAGPLPFIPLPPLEILVRDVVALIIGLSMILGVLGSIMGLILAKK